jgi:hypothetical protein
MYIPAESVYAAIEVKPTLNSTYIDYAAQKALSVGKLMRTTAPIVHAGGIIDDPKKPFNILAGILTIDDKCTDALKAKLLKLPEERFLHFGCSLDHVSFWFEKKEKAGRSSYFFPESAFRTSAGWYGFCHRFEGLYQGFQRNLIGI